MFCSIKLSEERKQNVFMSQFSSTKIFLSLGSFSSTPKTYLKTKSEKDKENSSRRSRDERIDVKVVNVPTREASTLHT